MKVSRFKLQPDTITLSFETEFGVSQYILPIVNYNIESISDTLYIDSVVFYNNNANKIEKYLIDDRLINGVAYIRLYYLLKAHEFNEEIDEVYISNIGGSDYNATLFKFVINIKDHIKDYAKFI